MSGYPPGLIQETPLDELRSADLPLPAPTRPADERINVLHVDDETAFGEMVQSFLQRANENLSVVTATSAEDGLARLDREPVDCIVSDYDMPGMDGLELLQTIRDDAITIPFILFTGKGSEEIASDAIAAGVTDYMQKATGTDQYELLANRIENVVDRHRAETELVNSLSAYRHLVEQELVGIYVIQDERVAFVNRMVADLLGYDRGDLVGRPLLEIIDEADHETVRENLRKRRTGEVESVEYSVGLLRADGTRMDTRVHGGAVEINGEPAVMGVLLEE